MICGQLKTDHELNKCGMCGKELLRKHEVMRRKKSIFSESLIYS